MSGLIKNTSDSSRSYHLSIHGRAVVGHQLFQVGLFGQTDTPVLSPGQVAQWVTKLPITADAPPDSLRYQVEVQRTQGEIEVNRLDGLEALEQLGVMAHLMFAQVAATVRSLHTPATEGDAAPPEPPHRPSISEHLKGAPVAPSSIPSAVPGSDSVAEAVPAQPWRYQGSGVPLVEWKGMGKMTRQATVPAFCQACRYAWELDSTVTNTIAQELGLGGRLQRRGKAMEQFGATYTAGASGRRIAAGNERQRMNDELAMLFMLAACPSCGGTDILLAKV